MAGATIRPSVPRQRSAIWVSPPTTSRLSTRSATSAATSASSSSARASTDGSRPGAPGCQRAAPLGHVDQPRPQPCGGNQTASSGRGTGVGEPEPERVVRVAAALQEAAGAPGGGEQVGQQRERRRREVGHQPARPPSRAAPGGVVDQVGEPEHRPLRTRSAAGPAEQVGDPAGRGRAGSLEVARPAPAAGPSPRREGHGAVGVQHGQRDGQQVARDVEGRAPGGRRRSTRPSAARPAQAQAGARGRAAPGPPRRPAGPRGVPGSRAPTPRLHPGEQPRRAGRRGRSRPAGRRRRPSMTGASPPRSSTVVVTARSTSSRSPSVQQVQGERADQREPPRLGGRGRCRTRRRRPRRPAPSRSRPRAITTSSRWSASMPRQCAARCRHRVGRERRQRRAGAVMPGALPRPSSTRTVVPSPPTSSVGDLADGVAGRVHQGVGRGEVEDGVRLVADRHVVGGEHERRPAPGVEGEAEPQPLGPDGGRAGHHRGAGRSPCRSRPRCPAAGPAVADPVTRSTAARSTRASARAVLPGWRTSTPEGRRQQGVPGPVGADPHAHAHRHGVPGTAKTTSLPSASASNRSAR